MTKAAATLSLVKKTILATQTTATDRELLRQFAEDGDQEAFAALVKRHTALVLGVCRRALPTAQDAEDACQATFLILARKARGRWQESVANWLFATARRVSRDARRTADRRVKRERRAAVSDRVSPIDQISGRELLAIMDEELARLSPLYREPLVLYYLEELARDEIAARLNVPVGTVKIRLERGRKKLGDALDKRGVALGAGLLALAATSRVGAFPARLLDSILAAGGGSPSKAAAALAQGVAVSQVLTKAKVIAVALIGAAVLGFGIAAMPIAAEPQEPATEKPDQPKPPAGAKAGVTERTITGKVLGPDGKPVAAELILFQQDRAPRSLGESDAGGAFSVAVPSAADVHLVARADGLGAGFAFSSPYSPTEVTFRLPNDHPIRGRVIDTQGQPVAGATVFPQRLDDYGTRAADVFLDHWKTRDPQGGRLYGEHELRLELRTDFALPDGRTVLAAKTGADGTFELRGLGAERVVDLFVRSPGIADTNVLVVNRADFDPAAINQTAADNHERITPKSIRAMFAPHRLHGPNVTFVAEQEKLIRGLVKDRDTGKPRAGVEVAFGRVSNMELLPHSHTAKTDEDGRFAIRGSRKHSAYVVEVAADTDAGYLPSQTTAADSAGYEPIDVQVLCAKGLILTGKLTDKGTGKPLAGIVTVDPMRDNPYLQKYPEMNRSPVGVQQCVTRDDGSYRLVIPPGPVIVMAGLRVVQNQVMYQPAQADPKYPQYFRTGEPLMYNTSSGGYTTIRGCWCNVIEPSERDKTVTFDIALEPAKRKAVRVVDQKGLPVSDCDATGIVPRDMYPVSQESLYVYGLEAKEQRVVVVCNQRRKLVGSAIVKESDADPVVTLGPGAVVTGRAVDTNGQPLAGLNLHLRHTRREAQSVFELLAGDRQVVTAADGTFQIDGAIPGHEFRIAFSKGSRKLGPTADTAPRHTAANAGGTKPVGDLKVEPRENNE